MQLIYLIEIFEDNYNIVRDCVEADSVNVMKIGRLLQRNKGNFNIHHYLRSVYKETMKIVTRNNNTQNVRKPYWFVTNS